MISLKLLILVKSLPFLVFLTIFLSNQIVYASKSHLEHYKYKHSSSDLIKNKYIVEFSTGHDSGLSDTFFDSFRQDFSNVNIKPLHNYKSPIFHGLAFHIDAPDSGAYSDVMNAMMDHPDVENVYPQARMVRSSRNFGKSGINLAIDPTDLVNPHQMTQVKRVHEELKNKGKGIFIGIIDSGIDYNHPALGGGFGKGYKVATGYDLVGDHYDPDEHENPLEDEDPYDSCPDIAGGNYLGIHAQSFFFFSLLLSFIYRSWYSRCWYYWWI
jgi:hypothetical protein